MESVEQQPCESWVGTGENARNVSAAAATTGGIGSIHAYGYSVWLDIDRSQSYAI